LQKGRPGSTWLLPRLAGAIESRKIKPNPRLGFLTPTSGF
jgi:hypothetical protein